MKSRIWIGFLVLCVLPIANSTLSPTKRSGAQKSTKKSKSKDEETLQIRKGPQDVSVHDLGLLDINPTVGDILVNNGAWKKPNLSVRNVSGVVLGYVTPVSVILSYF